MYQFKLLLESFVKGKANLADLIREINLLAKEDDTTLDQALLYCEELTQQGTLTTEDFSRLKQELEKQQSVITSTTVANVEETVLMDTSAANVEGIEETELMDSTATELSDAVTAISQKTEIDFSNLPQAQDEREQLEIGSKLKDRFILVEELGRGGMGIVYKARDFRKEETHDSEPFVAIKVLAKELQERKILVIALQRETKKAQILAHPNIITVFDFDRDGDNVFMTMEYLEGETLDEIIKKQAKKPMERKRALSIIEQMGRALAYAHKRGIVHSDFKPGNVFVTKSDVVKVLDFGIARAVMEPGQRNQGDMVFDAGDLQALTPAYASKEMLEGKDPDPRDDIYGLAIVASLLLTGKHPFHKVPATKAHSRGFKPLHIYRLPRSIRKSLSHALEFNRKKRTASANQFLEELDLRPRRKKSLKRRFFEIAVVSILMLLTFYSMREYLTDGQEEIILAETASIANPEKRQRVESLLEIAGCSCHGESIDGSSWK